MLYSRRHPVGNPPFLAHPFFLCSPCPPHPSLVNFNSPLSGYTELLFSVEKREHTVTGLGEGSGLSFPTGKTGLSFKNSARKKGEEKMGNCQQVCVCVNVCVCRYQMARVTAWTKDILRSSLPKIGPITLHNFIPK